ncbi:MAG: hypothetical protein ACR2OO_06205 [Thermomicrobiales bacterium]
MLSFTTFDPLFLWTALAFTLILVQVLAVVLIPSLLILRSSDRSIPFRMGPYATGQYIVDPFLVAWVAQVGLLGLTQPVLAAIVAISALFLPRLGAPDHLSRLICVHSETTADEATRIPVFESK